MLGKSEMRSNWGAGRSFALKTASHHVVTRSIQHRLQPKKEYPMSNEPLPPDQASNDAASLERIKLDFDKEKHARERWKHEDDLVNQRTTWLIQTQGVLGGAFAYLQFRITEVDAGLVTGLAASAKAPYISTLGQFSRGLQLIGFLSCAVLLLGIIAAHIAQTTLQREHPQYKLGVASFTTTLGHGTAIAIPIACLAMWAFGYVLLR
jgi:hypothetical protein